MMILQESELSQTKWLGLLTEAQGMHLQVYELRSLWKFSSRKYNL